MSWKCGGIHINTTKLNIYNNEMTTQDNRLRWNFHTERLE